MHTGISAGVLFTFGLFFGSFINALVWRLRNKKSIARGRSICPKCKHQLKALDLLPVLSWLLLKGKCRYCKKPISVQYPIVELVTAVLFLLVFLDWQFITLSSYLLLAIWLGIAVVLTALAVYDLRWMLLPNKLIEILLYLALIQLFMMLILGELILVAKALFAAVLGGGFFYLLFAYSKGKWMGGGDVKLVFTMGLLLGLSKLAVALMVAFNSGAIIGMLLLASKKYTKKSLMPFGPFLILGVVIAQLYGNEIINWYLGLFTLSGV